MESFEFKCGKRRVRADKTNGDQVALAGVAKSEADVNQQVAIFENSPGVSSVTVSNVAAPQLLGNGWNFGVTLMMNPSVFLTSSQ